MEQHLGRDVRPLGHFLPNGSESGFVEIRILGIEAVDEHFLSRSLCLTNDEVPPNSLGRSGIVGRNATRSGKRIYLLENLVHGIARENAEIAIDNSVEFPLFMEPETEIVVDFLLGRNIFPKRKLEFVAISVDFGTGEDRMPNRTIQKSPSLEPAETFQNLFVFDTKLFGIYDGKPFASAVYLKMSRKRLFQRRMFQYVDNLAFDVSLAGLDNAYGNRLTRNHSTGDHNSTSIFGSGQSFSAENEFFYEYGRKYLIFVHNFKKSDVGK